MVQLSLYDLYIKLKETNSDSNFLCTEPVSFINTLCSDNKMKFIFAFKKIKVAGISNKAVKTENNGSETEKLELTGNPLEDDCTVDLIDENLNMELRKPSWKKAEEEYSHLDMNTARSILMEAVQHQCKFGSVWTLCKGEDDDVKTLLLEITFSGNGNISRGIVSFIDFTTFAKIDINYLIAKHFSNIINCQKLNTTIDKYYNILPNMILKFSQNTTSLAPVLNSHKNDDIILNQTIKIGDNNSVANAFWLQLIATGKIRDDIINYNSNENKYNLMYSCGSDTKLKVIKENIEQILLDVTPCLFNEDADSNFIINVLDKAKIRNYIDITDRLWLILKLCGTYNDLKAAFQHIFKFAAQRNIVNMPTSENHLAKLIREISQQRVAVPCLSGTEPLELLLEIGLEKLIKDYEYIFSESKICSGTDLNIKAKDKNAEESGNVVINVRKTLLKPDTTTLSSSSSNYRKTLMHCVENETEVEDIGFHNSKFDQHDVERKLAKLAQIHLILEHLTMIQLHLNPENMNIYQSIALQQLQLSAKPFNIIKSLLHDQREIAIASDKMINKVENSTDPHALRIIMSSENKFKRIKSTYYYSVDSIFPTNIFPEMEMNCKELTNAKQYCGFYYFKTESKSN